MEREHSVSMEQNLEEIRSRSDSFSKTQLIKKSQCTSKVLVNGK